MWCGGYFALNKEEDIKEWKINKLEDGWKTEETVINRLADNFFAADLKD